MGFDHWRNSLSAQIEVESGIILGLGHAHFNELSIHVKNLLTKCLKLILLSMESRRVPPACINFCALARFTAIRNLHEFPIDLLLNWGKLFSIKKSMSFILVTFHSNLTTPSSAFFLTRCWSSELQQTSMARPLDHLTPPFSLLPTLPLQLSPVEQRGRWKWVKD